MRAAAFIRYHSGEGFGHVGWAFDFGADVANAGSVENHSGHIISSSKEMGFWSVFSREPTQDMRLRAYDDVKAIDVPDADPVRAYRTVLWIQTMGYRAFTRNCEDDVYDVLRAFGVRNLAPPSWLWFPKSWFKRFRGELAHVADFSWPSAGEGDEPAPTVNVPDIVHLEPWHPTWRRPWHADFNLFHLRSLQKRPSN